MNRQIESYRKQFEYYKGLGQRTFDQVSDDNLFWQPNEESNSIAMLVKHLHGNMLSRWTDFLTTDGEKEWRKRDEEFENDIQDRKTLESRWNEGWNCLLEAITPLTNKDLDRTIYIRNMGHSVREAINRQLAHYPYHVGQIVFIGKLVHNKAWTSLSIPKGKSKEFNAEKFAKPKRDQHYTEDV